MVRKSKINKVIEKHPSPQCGFYRNVIEGFLVLNSWEKWLKAVLFIETRGSVFVITITYLLQEGTKVLERSTIRAYAHAFSSSSGVLFRRGLRSFSSANRMKSSAILPVKMGTGLIGVAISTLFLNSKIVKIFNNPKNHCRCCQGKTNSLDRLRKSRSFCSSSAVRRGVGFFAFSSANRSNSAAASPQSSGDDFIAVAFSNILLFAKLQHYNELYNYDV